jgi:hypothetical protein
MLGCHNWQVNEDERVYFSFAYSAFAAMRMGMSGSASFKSKSVRLSRMVKKLEWIEMAQLAVSSIVFKSLSLKLP